MEEYTAGESFSEAVHTGEVASAERKKPTAVFWRRLFAFIIDMILLGIIGAIFGLLWNDLFIRLGNWGRLIGFSIAFIYFVPLDSHLGNGQTIGKRLMKIKTIDGKGNYISAGIACLRYLIVAPIIFLNGLYFKNLDNPALYVIALLFFGSFIGTIYFYLFNKKTHQSLNDVVCGTFVVRQDTEGEPTKEKISQKHFYIFSALIAFSAVALFFVIPRILNIQFFKEIIQLRTAIEKIDDFQVTNVSEGKSYFNGNTQNFLRINISVYKKLPSYEETAKKVAASAIQNYPKLKDDEKVIISFVRGYDIGIASSYKNFNYSKTKLEWKKELGL